MKNYITNPELFEGLQLVLKFILPVIQGVLSLVIYKWLTGKWTAS